MNKTAKTTMIDITQDDRDLVESTPACEQFPDVHEELDTWLAIAVDALLDGVWE
ncbi:MAG: hypothetical protein ABSA26_18010 [Thermoguttaceae bacterium]|jgi:hypothetical protein